jgi:hypothetical protein
MKIIIAITKLTPTAISAENPRNMRSAIRGASVTYSIAAAGRQSFMTTILSTSAFRGVYAEPCHRVRIIYATAYEPTQNT